MKKILFLIVFFGAISLPIRKTTEASLVMGSFSGIVETVSGHNVPDLLSEISVGTPFVGAFSYDTNL